MLLIRHIVWCALIPLLVGCAKTGEETVTPSYLDQDASLIAACRYIDGGGSAVTGGDGGAVLRVSRLDDVLDPNTGLPAAGTLRYAVMQSGARRVIFSVSGTIHLTSELLIKNGHLTIDGQSAPGDGICLADYPMVIKASNVIVRFLRVRLGDSSNTESDAVSVNDAKGVVLDHLSCSWSVDECVSCYGNTDFTMQYCIVSESLKNSVHGKGNHGYGGIWGGTNASFHHNLLAHHDSRNPRFDHDYVNAQCVGPIDFVNNVVYNWGGNSAYGGEGSSEGGGGRHINFVNNYFKPGPATRSSVRARLVDPWTQCSNCTHACGGSVVPPKIYLTGNVMVDSWMVTENNWIGSTQTKEVAGTDTRWTDGLTSLRNEESADDAYKTVLAKAGCSLHRDALDERIVNEVHTGTSTCVGSNGSTGGLIDTQSDAGGWPELQSKARPVDSDYDGIPDEWEKKHHLDPENPDDAHMVTLVSGHTNMEVYMCDIVAHLY